ncbi:hypothetical protein [Desulfuromonas thiophila]|uniref:Uncharacterized protein n=1 Tax=Desulfuromonas thiophila TaxID=57664 RepID=A0A1G7ALE0_9BACT|nr:hypothetical protein [Desulfuromonas thiophila]SDE15698.1 hypothetical protein SAMN05661003_104110 [Desulfuromonas thiophila]
MLCGMFAAMLAYTALIQLVAKGLKIYIASATGTHILGPISILAFIVLSTIMFVYLTHKAFSIITHLAEKVLAWIGSGAGSFNEAAEEQRMNRVFMMAGNMKAKPGGGGGGGGGGNANNGGGNTNNSGGGGNTNNSGGKLAQSDANQGQSGDA